MGLREQKAQLKDIIKLSENTIIAIRNKSEQYNALYDLAVKLNNELLDVEMEDVFDLEDFGTKFIDEFLTRELDDLSSQMEEIDNEIRDFISEQPERKQEILEERYFELDTVSEYFSQSQSQYESLDDAINGIEEAIHLLKQMI